MKAITISLAYLLICGRCYSQEIFKTVKWPKPTDVKELLFYIQRDPNTNTVCYTANVKGDGNLDPDHPVDVFWMNYATSGKRSGLTALQRSFAYGVTVRQFRKDSIDFRIVAVPGRRLLLRGDRPGNYWVQTAINGKTCRLGRVYLNITGGSTLSPELSYIEIQGYRVIDKMIEIERIKVK